jgi:single-strand DNA-binding protein
MPSYNKVILIGHVTRDPELRHSTKGTAVCQLGLAVNREWKSESGEKREDVTFVDVDAFGRTAETIGQYLKKGRPVMVEGRLKTETWEDKQTGGKRSKLKVVCESFQFLGSRDADSGGNAAPPRPTAPARAAAPARPSQAASEPADDSEDSVPF